MDFAQWAAPYQNEIDFQAFARGTDPDTSHLAAQSMEGKCQRIEGIVLEALKKRGDHGATTRELAALTGLDWGTVTPRMKPMEKKGFITDSGHTRPGISNRQQIVWLAL